MKTQSTGKNIAEYHFSELNLEFAKAYIKDPKEIMELKTHLQGEMEESSLITDTIRRIKELSSSSNVC